MDILTLPTTSPSEIIEPDWSKLLSNADSQAHASEVWASTVVEMRAAGTLARANLEQIRRYALACVMYAHAASEIDRTGPVISTKRTKTGAPNPYWRVYKDCDAICSGHEASLGLNPAKRGHVAAAKKSKAKTGADVYLAG